MKDRPCSVVAVDLVKKAPTILLDDRVTAQELFQDYAALRSIDACQARDDTSSRESDALRP